MKKQPPSDENDSSIPDSPETSNDELLKSEALKKLPASLKDRLPPEVIETLSAEAITEMSLSFQTSHSIPAPFFPPAALQGYNDAFENGAERLFTLGEKQSDHRRSMEIKMVDHRIKLSERGQWMAFVLILILGCAGIYFLSQGKGYGYHLILFDLAAIAALFIANRLKRDSELKKKSDFIGRCLDWFKNLFSKQDEESQQEEINDKS